MAAGSADWRDKATGKVLRRYFGHEPEAEKSAHDFNADMGLAPRRSPAAAAGPVFGELVNSYAAVKAAILSRFRSKISSTK